MKTLMSIHNGAPQQDMKRDAIFNSKCACSGRREP